MLSNPNLRVAVNLSMNDLVDVDFADYFATETQVAGFEPKMLVLEVPEMRITLCHFP
jgi:EAL domain-containing protein (putative c-di-GMP-specific phosphodiesterase class I)